MKKRKENNNVGKEYYEYTVFKMKKGARLVEVLIGIAAVLLLMCWLCWPLVVAKIIVGYMRANDAGMMSYIILALCGIGAYIFNIYALTKLLEKRPINIIGKWYDPFEKERYYFNIPKAYEKVKVVDVTDEALIDEFYHKGALRLKRDIEDNYLSYVYNLINDNHDLHGESLTIYKISKELFSKHFPFNKTSNKDYHVFPVSYLGMSSEEYHALREEADKEGKAMSVLQFYDFSEEVEGVSFYRKKTYYYRDEVKEFYGE